MKLSDAILLGSIGTVQAFGKFYDDGKTCAMGAGLSAIGKLVCDFSYKNFYNEQEAWPYCASIAKCPECCDDWIRRLRDVVAHLNNEHTWTRPRIAAWVAEKERELGIADDEVLVAKTDVQLTA